MLYHFDLYKGTSLMDWWNVIWHGLKLDCCIAGYLTIIPLLLIMVSVWFPGEWLKKTLKGYYWITAALIALIFAGDIALYGYWGFRLDTTPLFYLQQPKDAMNSVPVGTIILQVIMFVLYSWGIIVYIKRIILSWVPTESFSRRIICTITLILLGGILFLPIRGGVTTSTANTGMVYFSNNQRLNHAAINPCFSLLESISKQQDFASQFNFFPEEERSKTFHELFPAKSAMDNKDNNVLKTRNPNLLFILLESFSAKVVEPLGGEKGITPNLNRLCQEGILFTQMYAGSFRTDRGLVAILNGYPAQPTTSIMKYPAKSQTLPSISKTLTNNGYTADMLYGGDINFTNMQSYFFSSGYSHITADRDFPLSSRLSKWGANDDITFRHLYQSIAKRETTPWLTTFLTLSSHEPFEVPFKKLDDPYLNSVAFTDSCLGDFIDRVKLLPVWDNLLIVLVSDHGFRYPHDINEYDPRRYHIPMLWIGGAIKEPMIIDRVASQTDIATSLLMQMDMPVNEFTFSNNIFDPTHTPFAFYSFNNGFGFIDPTGCSVFDNAGNIPLIESPENNSSDRIRKGKTILQTVYKDISKR